VFLKCWIMFAALLPAPDAKMAMFMNLNSKVWVGLILFERGM
jgi:hypothetical protein